ncbi:glycosyltransferase BC10-like isoform X2 [Phragmites australis]|uniref:glycosyltransferase BC10-like isoform X2 n=1 Tax=Phragmites australis TaxID=29695 RepID=UPI002D7788B8|nr:glycosyltransferase BC10-like isoform X2 [Phragmites australis]
MPVKRSVSLAALPLAGRRARARLCLRLAAPLSFLLLLTALLRARPFLGVPPAAGPAKVAFLFLVRAGVPLDFLWDAFFRNGEEGRFSVYVHSAPGFQLDRTTTGSPYFYGRQLTRGVKVSWGEATMVEAERMLFAAALQDPANQRFVLLSDSCVPLYNFSYIYTYLMASPKSFVDSFIDKTEKRYNPNMSPAILNDKWRKGSQWVALIRKHAEVVVGDKTVLQVFRRHCKMVMTKTLARKPNARRLGFNFQRNQKRAAREEHDCIPDEHYVQTLFSIKGLEDELERRTLTYTSWNRSSNPKDKMAWHPMKFEYDTSSPEHISAIKSIDHVNYQMEYRTEWCQCNSSSVPCFLFARKFSYSAAIHLLEQGAVGPRKSAQLLVNF